MSKVYNVAEARAHFSELLDRAAAGEEILIAKSGKPVARIAPIALERRQPGALKDLNIPDDVWLQPTPIEEIEAWEGKESGSVGTSRQKRRR
jgi:prevent-host-death family protein